MSWFNSLLLQVSLHSCLIISWSVILNQSCRIRCRILYKCHFLSLPVMLYWLCPWNGHNLIAGVCQPGGREPQRAELIREEPKARCWFLPLSGCSTCRCATSAGVMAGLWKPSAAKTLMCFRWRAGPACGWIFVLLLVVKMYVNPQVTGLSNKSSDGVPAFPRVLTSFSWNCSDGSINLVERDKTNLWFCCDFCKCGLTPPPPNANKHDYVDRLKSPSRWLSVAGGGGGGGCNGLRQL